MRYLVHVQCQLCIKTVRQNVFYRIVIGMLSLSSEERLREGWGHQNLCATQGKLVFIL